MATIDVRCDAVSKRYRRPQRRGAAALTFLGRTRATLFPPSEDFWALHDVSFDIAAGETLGVVGRNGAGKSTLLKLLGGITAPTAGEITIVGRLAALIEVGSGFHPELTGRENVFLSGAILGMRRRHIAARLDSIADFSGVGAFLDTPVKYYSSGMYVRLGFAIAAHLEPDVLLVDEVLAVGDSQFQVRCLQRIEELKRRGTTMVLVSHDLGAVEQLSDRAVLIEGGRVAASGSPHEVIGRYERLVKGIDTNPEAEQTEPGSHQAPLRIEGLTLHAEDGSPLLTAMAGRPLIARIMLVCERAMAASVTLSFYDFDAGTLLAECTGELRPASTTPSQLQMEFVLPELLLAPGVYTLGAVATPTGAARAVAWRFGRTTLYVQGSGAARGVFMQPFQYHTTLRAAAPAEAQS